MEKIKERTEQYAISVRTTNNGYFEARISFKLGYGRSPRLQKGGKSQELAILNLLIALGSYIDSCYKSGLITTKIDDCIPQRLMKSINDLGVITPEISTMALSIFNKIAFINSNIMNSIAIPNNIIPMYSTSNNIPNTLSPITYNINDNSNITNVISNKKQEICVFEDIANEWHMYRLSLCKKTEDNPRPLAQTTVDKNYVRLEDDIIPFFKKKKIIYLSQITEQLVNDLLKSIKCQNSKHKAYIILNMLFKYAIKKNKINYNPLKNVKKPPEKIKTGSENDDENYIESTRQDIWLDKFELENTDMSLLFETMLLTGLRPEEACGLKWKALDLENNELIINNAYKSFIKYDKNGKKIGHYRSDDKLKTPESYRRIPLNPRLREILLKHKENQQELFKKSRAIKNRHWKWNENQYIFLGRNYYPYVSDDLSSGLRTFRIKYDLEYCTPYGLRHSFATFCSEQGMEEIVLMKLMGHSNYETTVRYYLKVSAKRKRLAMQEAYKVVFYERKAS